MALSQQSTPHTESDYYNLPEDVRAELINGELVYNQAAPSRLHQTILMELSGTIREYIRTKMVHAECILPHLLSNSTRITKP